MKFRYPFSFSLRNGKNEAKREAFVWTAANEERTYEYDENTQLKELKQPFCREGYIGQIRLVWVRIEKQKSETRSWVCVESKLRLG